MLRLPSNTQIQWIEDKTAAKCGENIKKQKLEDNQVEIPVWSVQEIDDDYKYTLPKKYIKFQGVYEISDYELDEEDENFVTNNKLGKNKNKKQFVLTEDILERTLDFFEKESFLAKEYSKLIPIGEKNLTPCCVCLRKDRRLPDGKISNSVMGTCLGCGIVSHASCQGKKNMENWICHRCAFVKKKMTEEKNNDNFQQRCLVAYSKIKCTICKQAEGSMLQRKDSSWVHTVCSVWLPGYSFQKIKKKRVNYTNKCIVCQESQNIIRCSSPNCIQHYHGYCARTSRFFLDCNFPEGYPISYCHVHSAKLNKQINEVFLLKSLATVEIGSFLTDKIHNLVQKKLEIEMPVNIFNLICEYWKKKRLSRNYGRTPLIPRLAWELKRPKSVDEAKLIQARMSWEAIKVSLTDKDQKVVGAKLLGTDSADALADPDDHLFDSSRSQLSRNKFVELQLAQIPTNFRITRRKLKETLGESVLNKETSSNSDVENDIGYINYDSDISEIVENKDEDSLGSIDLDIDLGSDSSDTSFDVSLNLSEDMM